MNDGPDASASGRLFIYESVERKESMCPSMVRRHSREEKL